MKIWLAYKYRGSDLAELRPQLEEVTGLLDGRGHQVLTMLKDIQHWNPDPAAMSKTEAVRRAYVLGRGCDLALCIYPTVDPSEGRGWDAGFFAGMGKPTIMAIYNGISIPYTQALFSENPANQEYDIPSIIQYETFADIADRIPASIERKQGAKLEQIAIANDTVLVNGAGSKGNRGIRIRLRSKKNFEKPRL